MHGGGTTIGTTTGRTIGIGHTDMITTAGTTLTIVSATIVVATTIGTKWAANDPGKPSGLKNRTAPKLKQFVDRDGRENFFGNTSLPFFYLQYYVL
jgi:hypothetical protein